MEIKIPIVIDDKAFEKAINNKIAELKQKGDFVLVTRCENCKHYINEYCYSKPICDFWGCYEDPAFVSKNSFCSYAEPKEIEEV